MMLDWLRRRICPCHPDQDASNATSITTAVYEVPTPLEPFVVSVVSPENVIVRLDGPHDDAALYDKLIMAERKVLDDEARAADRRHLHAVPDETE